MAAMGIDFEGATWPADTQTLLQTLLLDRTAPQSIAYAIEAARENARRSREVVSSEVWEGLNTTYNAVLGGQLQQRRPADAFRFVRERASMITALVDNTQSHDDGWQFIVLGRCIERVDMTARLVTMGNFVSGPNGAWALTLRACGASHAFTRVYRVSESPRAAAEFLLLDRLFPRSISHLLEQAGHCLEELDPRSRRVGFGGDAARVIGQAHARLSYLPLTDLVTDLPGEMEELQRVCAGATAAIATRYFEGVVAPEWLTEAL